jgi:IPT/TIG domain
MANNKTPSSTPPKTILYTEVVYLLFLLAIGLIYVTDLHKLLPFPLPDSFGPIPIGVPWYGALGAVIISLSGMVDHRKDWDPSLIFWHLTRPLIGASLAIISVLIFQAGILAVASIPTSSKGVPPNLLYYLIAFVVGYREEIFRDLIKRLADVILTPGGGAPPPAISVLKPPSGKVAGGDKVTITGSGFTGTTSVKFGPTLATNFQVDSDGQITATTPPGTAGTVSVTVTTKAGSVTGGEFTYITTDAAPTVTGINPTSGTASGGISVTITGTGFNGATGIAFGSTAASNFTVNSDTQIMATSPVVSLSGAVDVTVTTPNGTSATSNADQFTYLTPTALPTLTSISPASGPDTGGTAFVITGTGFTGATGVSFGRMAASNVSIQSDTQITATSPAGSGTVDVTVTTPGGTSATSSADQFTYT